MELFLDMETTDLSHEADLVTVSACVLRDADTALTNPEIFHYEFTDFKDITDPFVLDMVVPTLDNAGVITSASSPLPEGTSLMFYTGTREEFDSKFLGWLSQVKADLGFDDFSSIWVDNSFHGWVLFSSLLGGQYNFPLSMTNAKIMDFYTFCWAKADQSPWDLIDIGDDCTSSAWYCYQMATAKMHIQSKEYNG